MLPCLVSYYYSTPWPNEHSISNATRSLLLVSQPPSVGLFLSNNCNIDNQLSPITGSTKWCFNPSEHQRSSPAYAEERGISSSRLSQLTQEKAIDIKCKTLLGIVCLSNSNTPIARVSGTLDPERCACLRLAGHGGTLTIYFLKNFNYYITELLYNRKHCRQTAKNASTPDFEATRSFGLASTWREGSALLVVLKLSRYIHFGFAFGISSMHRTRRHTHFDCVLHVQWLLHASIRIPGCTISINSGVTRHAHFFWHRI